MSRPLHIYRILQFSNGLATGLWMGVYAWFLFSHLGLTATQIGVIVGASFLFQIVVEIPSGAWADRGNHRRILVASFASFVAFCGLYAWLATLGGGVDSLFIFVIAIAAEICFGLGSALLSGTLDAWVADEERSVTDQHRFRAEIKKINSQKQVASGIGNAVGGAIGLCLLATDHTATPFVLSGVAYAIGLVASWFLPRFSRARDRQRTLVSREEITVPGAGAVSRHGSRAIAFMREHPEVATLVVRSALIYAIIFASQVLWALYLGSVLFVSPANELAAGVPLLAVLWAVGESSRALGGFAARKEHADPTGIGDAIAKRSGDRDRQLSRTLSLFGLGFVIQVVPVMQREPLLHDWRIVAYALGYCLTRFAEGGLRCQLDAQIGAKIISDRATVTSISSFVQSGASLFFLSAVGYLMDIDPVVGYMALAGCSIAAAVTLPSGRSNSARAIGSGFRRADTSTGWRPDRAFLRSPTIWYVTIVAVGFTALGVAKPSAWQQLVQAEVKVKRDACTRELIQEGRRGWHARSITLQIPAGVECRRRSGWPASVGEPTQWSEGTHTTKSRVDELECFVKASATPLSAQGVPLKERLAIKRYSASRRSLVLALTGLLVVLAIFALASRNSVRLVDEVLRLNPGSLRVSTSGSLASSLSDRLGVPRALLGATQLICGTLDVRNKRPTITSVGEVSGPAATMLPELVAELRTSCPAESRSFASGDDGPPAYYVGVVSGTGEGRHGFVIATFENELNPTYITPLERTLVEMLAFAAFRELVAHENGTRS